MGWRRRRSEVEADISELCRAYEEGGLSAANSTRMSMLRAEAEGPQTEEAPKGELSEAEMAKRYGKGFKFMTSMGFAAGGGLGRDSQGRTTPVEAADADISQLTASRHIGLGFADAASLG